MGYSGGMSDIFSVLADPTRRALLLALASKSQSVGDLVTLTGEGQPTVSKHLKTLREAGLVSVEAAGQARVYSIDRGPLGEVLAFFNDVAPGLGGEGAGAGSTTSTSGATSTNGLEETLTGAAVVLSGWLSSGASWLNDKVQEKVAASNLDADELGKRLGRKLAEAQSQATLTAADLEAQLRVELADFTDKLGVRAADFRDAAEVIISDVMASAAATIDSVRGDRRKEAPQAQATGEAEAKPNNVGTVDSPDEDEF